MNRVKWMGIVLLIGLIAVGVPLHAQEQERKDEHATHQHEEKDVYTCEMHPEVKADKPGKCPKCGMNLVLKETAKSNTGKPTTPSEKIANAKSLLTEAKKALMKEGKYNCCIEDPCDECALAHQSCPCANNVKAGKEVCSQCYGGWQRGEGAVPGVKPSQVKGSSHSHKH